MSKLKKVLIMAGGTGGHVFPGLAIAAQLKEQGVEVHWLGTQKGMESTLVPNAQIPIHYISISGLRGKSLKEMALAPFRILVALMQSLKVIHALKPDVVIGMGGYVSGPGGLASWVLRKPLVIHEQNARVGSANRWLSPFAIKVLEGFPHTFSSSKAVTTGNPVRATIAGLSEPTERMQGHSRPWRLLILGGSGGALAINEMVPKALAKLPEGERPEVYHQTGEKYFAQTQELYRSAGIQAKISPFIDDMDKAYAWADVVLCRSGALTIAELCAAGVGAILIPFPYAVDDHQTENAKYMSNQQAAILMQQSTLTEEGLADLLKELGASPEKRLAMAKAAYQLRRVDATRKVLTICEEVCS